MWVVAEGDCLDVLKEMPDNWVDAVVTDPPYGLEFMGKEWDSPWKGRATAGFSKGGYTHSNGYANRQTPAYGQGLAAMQSYQAWCQEWATELLRVLKPGGHLLAFGGTRTYHRLASAIEDAGFEIRDSLHWIYGTGFPKSLNVAKAIDKAAGAEGEVIAGKRQAVGVFAHSGTGVEQDIDAYADAWHRTAPSTDAAKEWAGWGTALKPAHEPIAVARKPLGQTVAASVLEYGTGAINIDACRVGEVDGRWPPNALFSVEAAEAELGEASRFFPCFRYQAKASTKERPVVDGVATHPTVKPVALMQWLVTLVTPPGGCVLDPFAGSGTTAEACELEGFDSILIERDPDSVALLGQRMSKYQVEAA